MKTEDLKKHAVWIVPLLLVVVFLSVYFVTKAASKPEEPEEDTPKEAAVQPVTEAEATSMHLRRSEGELGVTDGDGKDCPPRVNMGLYSGYHLLTQPVSYAWIDLDDVKLAKMDENSEVGIRKEGKDLTLYLSSGGLFFNITEPLPEDETLNIRCSSMAIGVRGTCGWVQLTEDKHVMVYLLEGEVECKVTDGAGEATMVQVSAGEVGDLYVTPEGAAEVEVVPFAENYVAPFVMDELDSDAGLRQLVLEASGLDVENPPDPVERLKAEYQEIIDVQPLHAYGIADGAIEMYYVDLDHDGWEELLIFSESKETCRELSEELDWCYSSLSVYGNFMGHVTKYGEVVINADGDYATRFNYFRLGEKNGKTYIGMHCNFYDDYGNFAVYGVEHGKLYLADYFNEGTIPITGEGYDVYNWNALGYTPWNWEEWNRESENVCPSVSPDLQRREQFMIRLFWLQFSNNPYAKLIDMNHDGVEDLIFIDYMGQSQHVCAYLWDGSSIQSVDLGSTMADAGGTLSLYRERATGDIYAGSHVVWGTAGQDWYFRGISNSVDYGYESVRAEWLDPELDDVDAIMAAKAAEYQSILADIDQRFELIEEIHSDDAAYATIDAVRQQLING